MAHYITESLEEGEEIILKGRLHWSAVFEYASGSIVLFISAAGAAWFAHTTNIVELYYASAAFVIFGLLAYLVGSIVRTRSEFALTTNRFIQKDGILNIKMTEIPLFKIETVNYYQNIWQRMLGTGCLELVGSGGTSHQVHAIEHPMQVRKAIVSAINKQAKNNLDA